MAPDHHRFRQGRGTMGLITALCLLLFWGCAGLPVLKPLVPGTRLDVTDLFPQGRWQLVHRIEARFPGNHKALMMGALELDSATGHLTCALMTVEGFTLFSASKTDRLRVDRAVPPFDKPGFAEGLMADLGLLLFPPPDARPERGTLDDGPVLRYRHHNGHTTDIVARGAGRFRIELYDADARSIRRAILTLQPVLQSPDRKIATEILLEAMGKAAYILRLDLIDAVPLGAALDNLSNGYDPKSKEGLLLMRA